MDFIFPLWKNSGRDAMARSRNASELRLLPQWMFYNSIAQRHGAHPSSALPLSRRPPEKFNSWRDKAFLGSCASRERLGTSARPSSPPCAHRGCPGTAHGRAPSPPSPRHGPSRHCPAVPCLSSWVPSILSFPVPSRVRKLGFGAQSPSPQQPALPPHTVSSTHPDGPTGHGAVTAVCTEGFLEHRRVLPKLLVNKCAFHLSRQGTFSGSLSHRARPQRSLGSAMPRWWMV